MGTQRQQHYLNAFQSLEPKAQQALADIYHQAHKGGKEMGRHVVMAMIAAVKHPELFRFTLANIVVRLMVKRFYLDKDWQKMLQMQAILDDFHAALDRFIDAGGHSAPYNEPPVLHLAILNDERSEVVQDLRAFKARAGKPVNLAKRVKGQH